MTAKIISAIATFLITIAIAVVVLFFMLVVMNGYSESDATWGLGTFLLLALLIASLMAGASGLLVHFLLRKQYRRFVSTLIGVPLFSIVGAGLLIVSSFIRIAVAECVRVNH